MDDRINLDVYGQMFAVPAEIIENGPPSRLKRMCKGGSSERIFINRPPDYFAAILAFYQTGELHIPMTACPGAFINELEYWEISREAISDCCYNRLESFLDEQDTLRSFQKSLKDEKTSLTPYCYFEGFRRKLWETVDYTKPTLIGKIYFIVTVFMVLLSIFVLAYSTDPSFLRAMTNCERLEYMASTDMDGYDIVKPHLEEFCSDSFLPVNSTNEHRTGNSTETFELENQDGEHEENDFISYLFRFVHTNVKNSSEDNTVHDGTQPHEQQQSGDNSITPPDETSTNWTRFWNDTDFSPYNESMYWNDTVSKNMTLYARDLRFRPPDIHILELFLETKYVKVPNLKIKLFILVILEGLTTIYFTVDILLRLYSCPNVKFYFFSVINCADALSLLGAYLYFLLYYMYPHLRYGSWIDNLSYIQMLRSFRLFRIVSNVRAGKVLAYTARKNIKDLFILILFLIAGMCTFASLFYVAEDKTTVESIPEAWYWAVITMTTVGYGDIKPQTNMGRLLACVCAVVGVILLALTVPIFANHFLVLYQHVESENIARKIQRKIQPPALTGWKLNENDKANEANVKARNETYELKFSSFPSMKK